MRKRAGEDRVALISRMSSEIKWLRGRVEVLEQALIERAVPAPRKPAVPEEGDLDLDWDRFTLDEAEQAKRSREEPQSAKERKAAHRAAVAAEAALSAKVEM